MPTRILPRLYRLSRFRSGLNYLLVTVLSLALVTAAWMLTRTTGALETQMREQHALSMSNNVQTMSTAVDLWVEAAQRVVRHWAQDPALRAEVEALLKVEPTPDQLRGSPALRRVREQSREWLAMVHGLGFFVIGPQEISYGSLRDENLGTRNFLSVHHPQLLRRAWGGECVVIPPVPSDVALDDRQLPARAYTSLFLATPILGETGLPRAVLTVRFASNQTVEQVLAAADRMKEVDTFAFDQNLRFVTPARNLAATLPPPASASAAGVFFDARVYEPATAAASARPTVMARRALAGTSGLAPEGYVTYDGRRVIGAWTWNERLGMGFASEIGERSALATLHSAHRYMTVLCAVMGLLCLVGVVLTVVFNRITHRSNRAIRTDPLTGIASRRCFDEQLEKQFEVAGRSGLPLTLMMIDVDHFKQYNDTYGHAAGDVCLEAVAKCLQAVCRRTADLAARVGGEEFALLLPMTDAHGAENLARELRHRLKIRALPHRGSPVATTVTCSVGVATVRRDGGGQMPLDLYEQADENLYGAKRAGRDQVVATGPDAASWRQRGAADGTPYPFESASAA